jgi:hypothetical protein
MQSILAITGAMLKDALRNKLFWGLVVFLLLFFGFSVYISFLSLGTPARFILNAGMAGMSLISLAVTILFGLYTLYQEKGRYELYVLLNRISRARYLIGKFCGTLLIQAIFILTTAIGIFFLTWYFGHRIAFEIFAAAYWSLLEFSLLMAIALFYYSLETSFSLNALLVIATYGVGHSMQEAVLSFIGLGRFGSKIHLYLVKVLCVIFPDFDFFDFRLALIHHEPIPWGNILISTGYWGAYLSALLIFSAFIMKRKDI